MGNVSSFPKILCSHIEEDARFCLCRNEVDVVAGRSLVFKMFISLPFVSSPLPAV